MCTHICVRMCVWVFSFLHKLCCDQHTSCLDNSCRVYSSLSLSLFLSLSLPLLSLSTPHCSDMEETLYTECPDHSLWMVVCMTSPLLELVPLPQPPCPPAYQPRLQSSPVSTAFLELCLMPVKRVPNSCPLPLRTLLISMTSPDPACPPTWRTRRESTMFPWTF